MKLFLPFLLTSLAFGSNANEKSGTDASGEEEPVLKGQWRSLPVSAPENQMLLHLDQRRIDDTNGTMGDAMSQNREIHNLLEDVIKMRYFSTYKVDLSDSRCPLKEDAPVCANRQCAIEPLSDKNIDSTLFNSQFLGRLRKDSVHNKAPEGQGCIPDDISLYHGDKNSSLDHDYCYPEDESMDSDGVWVDLLGNAERFTGYAGPSARNMWGMVYGENCFSYNGDDAPNSNAKGKKNTQPKVVVEDLAGIMARPAKRGVQFDHQDLTDELDLPQDCIEQRLFYRILSGMHASISTHLCYNYWNATTEQWNANFPDWLERVGWFEDRINNMFFDYTLISRAILKLVDGYESELVFSPTYKPMDDEVRQALSKLATSLRKSPLSNAINEQGLFQVPGTQALKKELRHRVRNVNALMSCVGCERCRLWAKIQTAGYGTALKILLELPEKATDDPELAKSLLKTFRRSELVALINTFGRISSSIYATDLFREEAIKEVKEQVVNHNSWKYQWNKVINETKEALSFIFRSYIDFPKNMGKLFLYYSTYYWEKLIRRTDPEMAGIKLHDFKIKGEL